VGRWGILSVRARRRGSPEISGGSLRGRWSEEEEGADKWGRGGRESERLGLLG
jgi:hypothetical protein